VGLGPYYVFFSIYISKSNSHFIIPRQSAQEFWEPDIYWTVQDILADPATILGQSTMHGALIDY
jgi:hypothetical protein